jgi:hypothetical protein
MMTEPTEVLKGHEVSQRELAMSFLRTGALLRLAYFDTMAQGTDEPDEEYLARVCDQIADDANMARVISASIAGHPPPE